jgi:hypothetical protein
MLELHQTQSVKGDKRDIPGSPTSPNTATHHTMTSPQFMSTGTSEDCADFAEKTSKEKTQGHPG